jgi:hypothetical protein
VLSLAYLKGLERVPRFRWSPIAGCVRGGPKIAPKTLYNKRLTRSPGDDHDLECEHSCPLHATVQRI